MHRLVLLNSDTRACVPDTQDDVPLSRQAVPRRRTPLMASPFRPLVLARDRLAVWSSPHASAYTDALMEIFPAHLVHHWRSIVLQSVSEETRKNYGAGLIRFAQFCDRYCVPEQLRMPASEALLSLFVAEMGAGKVHLGTVESWLAALALWCVSTIPQWSRH